MALSGRICIVTGATRGIGKGIALQLGEAGATVYITGRTLKSSEGSPGSLEDTAKEITDRGGKCVPVQCDHTSDQDIANLFQRVKNEQDGRLDLLVNNAYTAVNFLTENYSKKFWETPEAETWDIVNNVGLRNHYLCSVHAARMMVEQQHGLIVFVSSPGGLRYLFNVAYGVGKAACDRMAADMALELRKQGVACLSLWPGAVRTETIMSTLDNKDKSSLGGKQFEDSFRNGESIEFPGKAIVALMQDKNLMNKSGRVLITSDLADEYKFKDIDGRLPAGLRSMSTYLTVASPSVSWLGSFCPRWIKVPKWMLHMASYKF